MRDLVLKHLSNEFGPPIGYANVFTWPIDVGLGDGYAAVNVSVNCYKTPEDVKIWIFDPHVVKRGDGARYLKVPDKDRVSEVVEQVKHHLVRTRQRVRRRIKEKNLLPPPGSESLETENLDGPESPE